MIDLITLAAAKAISGGECKHSDGKQIIKLYADVSEEMNTFILKNAQSEIIDYSSLLDILCLDTVDIIVEISVGDTTKLFAKPLIKDEDNKMIIFYTLVPDFESGDNIDFIFPIVANSGNNIIILNVDAKITSI